MKQEVQSLPEINPIVADKEGQAIDIREFNLNFKGCTGPKL